MKNHFLFAIILTISGIVASCDSEPISLDAPQTIPIETESSDGHFALSESFRPLVAETRPSLAAIPTSTIKLIPSPTKSPAPTHLPDTATPIPVPAPDFPVYEGREISPTNSGVQIHLHRENLEQVFSHLDKLGVGGVKVQVSWKLYEPQPNGFDDFRFDELDHLVSEARVRDIRVLLSVAKAPEWSRPTTELDGPPLDFQLFERFMNKLASRYGDQVAAYELWNEPNLNREWNGMPLSATDLVGLIR